MLWEDRELIFLRSAYTGYIDVEARHLFFAFFESRRDPDRDDVVFWTNGGPGGSSLLGLFMELGPCRVSSPNETSFNPYSWNEYTNMFFIDQPVGTGFSQGTPTAKNEEDVAEQLVGFLNEFLAIFSELKGKKLWITGEVRGRACERARVRAAGRAG